jgi:hypothetical protein
LLNSIGITIDIVTFDAFLISDAKATQVGDRMYMLNAISQFVGLKAKANEIKGGSLRFFINLFRSNAMSISEGKATAWTHAIFKNEPKDFQSTFEGF